MNQPIPASPSPGPTEHQPATQQPSWFAWISLLILGILNAIAFVIAAPTLLMVVVLAADSDRGGIYVMGLPEFFYVPAQFVLFLPSLIIVIVAAVRRKFNLAYKLHLGLMVISAVILLMDIVGLIIMLAVIYA